MARHARLGPSSSDIWLTCSGAPAEWLKVPPRPSGFAAHEGTLAHALCEAASQLNAIPWTEGMTFPVEGDTIEVTTEMLNAVQLFTARTGAISDFALWRMVEEEVSLGWLWGDNPPEEIFGTADFAACDTVDLYVCDFKYGRGKAVKVERNTQLLIYAIGVLGRLMRERPDLVASIETVTLVIIQPRAGGAPVRQWTIAIGELLYWAFAVLKPSIDAIAAGRDLKLVAGSHCFFCAASLECPVYRKLRVRRLLEDWPDTDLEPEEEEIV